jgi:glycosyltransferase involved in cell wall biosynthesis
MAVTADVPSEDPKTVDVSVVIPVYGSEASLEALIDRVFKTLASRTERFEVICVDDDSPDRAWTVLEGLHQRHGDRLVAIRLMRNFGQHNATMCGLRLARGQVVVTMDDDLQHRPEDLPRLLQHLEVERLDVVYGTYAHKKHSTYRNFGSWVVNQVFRRIFSLPFNVSSFRAIRHQVASSITSYDLNYTFIDGLLAWTTTRIGHTPVVHEPRRTGNSGYGLSKLLVMALNLATNFSLAPLQIASWVGILAAVGGLTVGVIFGVSYLAGAIEVPGFASTSIAVLVLGGSQLLALGTIGEYLGRLHLNFNRKPQFLVRDTLADTEASSVSRLRAGGDSHDDRHRRDTHNVRPGQS